jgi:hypothetical protein
VMVFSMIWTMISSETSPPPRSDDAAGFIAEARACRDLAAEQISGGDIEEVEVPDEMLGLGAFASTGWAEECDAEHGWNMF